MPSHIDATHQEKWDAHSAWQEGFAAYSNESAFFDRLFAALMSESWSSLMDFGCATGLWSKILHVEGRRYVGVDRNKAAIDGAHRRWEAEPAKEFVLCDVLSDERLPFADGSFDAAVCIAVLQHNDDADEKPKVLSEIRRVLRAGGRLLIYETTYGPFNPNHTKEDEDHHCHSQAGWRAVIEPHGFICIHQDKDLHVFRAV